MIINDLYIIDGDDALNHKDVLKNCFFIAHKAKLDVVEFKSFVQREDKPPAVAYIYNKKYFSHIIHQPELRNKFIFRRENEATIFNRRIRIEIIRNALAIYMMYVNLFLLSGFILCIKENLTLIEALYETSSAIGTVGSSLGVTTRLSSVSKYSLASATESPESKAIKICPGIVMNAVLIPIDSSKEHVRIERSSQSPPRYIRVW